MDLYCGTCGEPWDNDSLHEEAAERGSDYRTVAADFRMAGCNALSTAFGPQFCGPRDTERAAVASAMYDLLGDDMDGAAAMMDDLYL